MVNAADGVVMGIQHLRSIRRVLYKKTKRYKDRSDFLRRLRAWQNAFVMDSNDDDVRKAIVQRTIDLVHISSNHLTDTQIDPERERGYVQLPRVPRWRLDHMMWV